MRKIPLETPAGLIDLMKRAWDQDAGKRPTFATIKDELKGGSWDVPGQPGSPQDRAASSEAASRAAASSSGTPIRANGTPPTTRQLSPFVESDASMRQQPPPPPPPPPPYTQYDSWAPHPTLQNQSGAQPPATRPAPTILQMIAERAGLSVFGLVALVVLVSVLIIVGVSVGVALTAQNAHVTGNATTTTSVPTTASPTGPTSPPVQSTLAPVTSAPATTGTPVTAGPTATHAPTRRPSSSPISYSPTPFHAASAAENGCLDCSMTVNISGGDVVALGKLALGDWIDDGQGGFEPVVFITPHGGEDDWKFAPAFETADGRSLACTLDHIVLTSQGDKPARDVRVGDYFVDSDSRSVLITALTWKHFRPCLPMTPSLVLHLSNGLKVSALVEDNHWPRLTSMAMRLLAFINAVGGPGALHAVNHGVLWLCPSASLPSVLSLRSALAATLQENVAAVLSAF